MTQVGTTATQAEKAAKATLDEPFAAQLVAIPILWLVIGAIVLIVIAAAAVITVIIIRRRKANLHTDLNKET